MIRIEKIKTKHSTYIKDIIIGISIVYYSSDINKKFS